MNWISFNTEGCDEWCIPELPSCEPEYTKVKIRLLSSYLLARNLIQEESDGGDDEGAQEQSDPREPGGAWGQPPHLEYGGGPGH